MSEFKITKADWIERAISGSIILQRKLEIISKSSNYELLKHYTTLSQEITSDLIRAELCEE